MASIENFDGGYNLFTYHKLQKNETKTGTLNSMIIP